MSQLIERTLDEAEAARKAEKALVWKIDLLLSAFGEFLQPFLRSPALSRNLGLCLLSARSLFALNWADMLPKTRATKREASSGRVCELTTLTRLLSISSVFSAASRHHLWSSILRQGYPWLGRRLRHNQGPPSVDDVGQWRGLDPPLLVRVPTDSDRHMC
jgi:hypothetical protein